MTTPTTPQRTELAQRTNDGIEVTLVWVHGGGEDTTIVTVYDEREDTYFEIPSGRYIALDVYHHPFAYRRFSPVDYDASPRRTSSQTRGRS
jgi:hypothetical protein